MNRDAEIFADAAGLPAGARAAFLDQACGGDAELRARVEALLRGHDEAHSFLQQPLAARPALAPEEKPGDRIGRYKLLERIGEGGCGVVYVAEQEEPVRRRVALKVIKLGMDTKEVIARFEAERQALALMDHPNIAKVLDAGATATGRPFFVMELVRGIRITDYCDQHNLSTEKRLRLFAQVCHAVQHAHQKGIIHRDLKPSNILVTVNDGAAVPKVIDFGIAKATQGRLTDQTIYTAFEQFIGTPAYMSPEQAVMTSVDIDTRSDIYSLGVLLYELLTGRTPFDTETLLQSGLDEMRRHLREVEPPKPSTRLSTMEGKAILATAQHRHTEPPKLISLIRGDLDWIVMKALEKDRTRRYESANSLADDLRRHLQHEPVAARPPSAAYRARKFIRRHRLGVAAGTAIAATLVLGIVLATWQAVRATRAEHEQSRLRLSEAAQRQRAEAGELAARRRAYAADMNLVQQALATDNLGRAQALLNQHRPEPGHRDLRDWEWRYLWSQARADEHEVLVRGTTRLAPISLSADGRLFARSEAVWRTTLGRGGPIVVADRFSGQTVWRRDGGYSPVFAHQGSRLAFAAEVPGGGAAPTVVDIATRQETRLASLPAAVRFWIAFTPDDRLLLMASRNWNSSIVTAWESATGKQVWQREISAADPHGPQTNVISPDGAWLAFAAPEGRVQLLAVHDGTPGPAFKVTESRLTALAFSSDSSLLATTAWEPDTKIRLWDARSGEARGVLEGHRTLAGGLCFTPDGRRLISSGDHTIRLWDWPTQQLLRVWRGHRDVVDGITLAPDGRNFVSRSAEGSVLSWNVDGPVSHPAVRTVPTAVWEARLAPDGDTIVAWERSGAVSIWDVRSLTKVRSWQVPAGMVATGMEIGRWSISPDATQVVLREISSGVVHSLDLATLTLRPVLPAGAMEGNAAAHFTGDGRYLLSLTPDQPQSSPSTRVRIWDAKTWQAAGGFTIPGDFRTTSTCTFPQRSPTLAVFHQDRLQIWDVTHPAAPFGELKVPSSWYHYRWNNTDLSPDRNWVAMNHELGYFAIWDLQRPQPAPVHVIRAFQGGGHSVAFSPDDRRLAAGSRVREAIKLWDSATWQELVTLPGEGTGFRQTAFSEDGHTLMAVATDAGTCHLWRAPSWAEIEAAEAADRQAGRSPAP